MTDYPSDTEAEVIRLPHPKVVDLETERERRLDRVKFDKFAALLATTDRPIGGPEDAA